MVNRIEVAPASGFSLDALTSAFNHAFTGYFLPMTQTPASLAEMMRENDVRADVSRILLLDGVVEGIGLVGIRGDRAWIGGMGIGPRQRGQGYGGMLLGNLLDAMREFGARSAQLEVLTVNNSALALYERAGFRNIRELRVYQGALPTATSDEDRGRNVVGARYRVVTPQVALPALAPARAVAPAWQREARSLDHVRRALNGLGLWEGERLRAYIAYGQRQGGVVVYDALSAGSRFDDQSADLAALLRRAVAHHPEALVRAINIPEGDPLGAALEELGCAVVAHQREMARAL